jgi:hypothetical protein
MAPEWSAIPKATTAQAASESTAKSNVGDIKDGSPVVG